MPRGQEQNSSYGLLHIVQGWLMPIRGGCRAGWRVGEQADKRSSSAALRACLCGAEIQEVLLRACGYEGRAADNAGRELSTPFAQAYKFELTKDVSVCEQ